jgi:hypothetical protein
VELHIPEILLEEILLEGEKLVNDFDKLLKTWYFMLTNSRGRSRGLFMVGTPILCLSLITEFLN